MENERLRIQHREDHLRNRQTTYHEFLDASATWERSRRTTQLMFGEAPGDVEEENLRTEDQRFRHLLNAVVLFGTDPVKTAATEFDHVHNEILTEWWGRLNERRRSGQPPEPVGFAFPMHRTEEWDQAREKLIEAMRSDVAPDTGQDPATRL